MKGGGWERAGPKMLGRPLYSYPEANLSWRESEYKGMSPTRNIRRLRLWLDVPSEAPNLQTVPWVALSALARWMADGHSFADRNSARRHTARALLHHKKPPATVVPASPSTVVPSRVARKPFDQLRCTRGPAVWRVDGASHDGPSDGDGLWRVQDARR